MAFISEEERLSVIKTWSGILVLASLGVGCSQIVGLKEVSLEDADVAPDGGADAMPMDGRIDAPPPELWVFVTNASFAGGFGASSGARTTADIKCQDMYNQSFAARGCSLANVHAVLQIDDTVDSLARMDLTFPIPQNAEVLRATDATPVAQNWDTLVNPNAALLAPVSSSTTAVPFWSGRGVTTNSQCANWTSAASGMTGNAGDATKVNAWMAQSSFTCNNFNQRLLCICW